MGEAPAVGLEQPQLAGAKIQAEPGGHWNDFHSIAQLAFFPPLADVIWAVSVLLVLVSWTRTVEVVLFSLPPAPWVDFAVSVVVLVLLVSWILVTVRRHTAPFGVAWFG